MKISAIHFVIIIAIFQFLIIPRFSFAQSPTKKLYLHGGPGNPEIFLMRKIQTIENDFVMVYWKQRGAGNLIPKIFLRKASILNN